MARMTRTRVAAPAEDYDETVAETAPQDEAPMTVTKTRMRRPTGPISSGWGAPPVQRRETVSAPYLKVEAKKKIVKILEDAPAVRYKQHYLNNIKKYMTCTEVEGETACPLCAVGHSASWKYMVNVVEMSDPETVKIWTFGPEVRQLLEEHLEDEDRYPLASEKTYFQVWRVTGANNRIQNRLKFIRASLLQEDYDLEPLNDEELESLQEQMYGEETVWITSDKLMREAATGYAAWMASQPADD